MRSVRTDMAMEVAENLSALPEGIKVEESKPTDGIIVTRVFITSKGGAEAMGKPIGTYITIELKDMEREDASDIIAKELREVVGEYDGPALVVGLGNRAVTPDALGPKVCGELFVTRHIKEYVPEYIDERAANVCAIAPGVLGVTGLETGEVISGLVREIKPGVIIAIDALASRKTDRIGVSVQISDTGICPGSGIGNNRRALNKETLGVPVIAIGVPMVVFANTIAADLIESAGLASMDTIIDAVMSARGGELIVTPKNIDVLIDKTALVMANAINLALNDKLSISEIKEYMQ